MDGLAVLNALAEDPQRVGRRHAIILLTARHGPALPLADAQLLTQHGATLVPKPFDVEALLQAVADASNSLSA